jgi:hypothetical protein
MHCDCAGLAMHNFDSTPLVMEMAANPSPAKVQVRAPLVGTITSLENLREHLQWAIELEHSTILLCALYSIEPGRNSEAVEVLSGVLVEEMLDLTLAGNLANAVGRRPRLDTPQMLPAYRRSFVQTKKTQQ